MTAIPGVTICTAEDFFCCDPSEQMCGHQAGQLGDKRNRRCSPLPLQTLSPTGRWGGDTKAQVTTEVEHENKQYAHIHTNRPSPSAHPRSSVSRLKTIKQNARTKHAKTKPLLIPSAPCSCCPSSLFSFQSQISEESSPAASTALPLASSLLLSLDVPLRSTQARSSPRPAGTTSRLLVSFSALEPDSPVSSTQVIVPSGLETHSLGSNDTTCSCICSALLLMACPPLSKCCRRQSPGPLLFSRFIVLLGNSYGVEPCPKVMLKS